jgi:hypothetical protein
MAQRRPLTREQRTKALIIERLAAIARGELGAAHLEQTGAVRLLAIMADVPRLLTHPDTAKPADIQAMAAKILKEK